MKKLNLGGKITLSILTFIALLGIGGLSFIAGGLIAISVLLALRGW